MKLCTLQSFIFWEFANSSSLTWPACTDSKFHQLLIALACLDSNFYTFKPSKVPFLSLFFFSFSFLFFFFTFQCQLSKGWSQGLTYERTTSTSTFSAKVFLASVPSLSTQIARSLLVLQKKNKQTNKKTNYYT